MSTAAAFFDLDRTLMSGSSAFYFGKAVYREGMLPLHRLTRDAISTLLFKLFGASDEKSEATRDRILAAVAGQEAEQFQRLSPSVIEELLPKIRPEAQALLDMHESAGRDVWILSASPVEIVGELAKALEITGGIGTESEIVDGVYTGRLAAPFCYGEGKAEHIRRLAATHGYDLQQCYSYSDSASDLPMMQIVGNPIAVNPDRPMMAVAHRRGWPVVEFNRERKQIIRLAAGGTGALTAGTAGYLLGRRQGRRSAALHRRAGRLIAR
jgi:HAD superfamily hydrolase (TIGR01490 family)